LRLPVDFDAVVAAPLKQRCGMMPGVLPRCVPVATKSNQHGEQSTTVVVGIERVLHRRRWRSVEVLTCPVT